jgi:hypothetical protein
MSFVGRLHHLACYVRRVLHGFEITLMSISELLVQPAYAEYERRFSARRMRLEVSVRSCPQTRIQLGQPELNFRWRQAWLGAIAQQKAVIFVTYPMCH